MSKKWIEEVYLAGKLEDALETVQGLVEKYKGKNIELRRNSDEELWLVDLDIEACELEIERKKRSKVVKSVDRWVNVYNDERFGSTFSSEEEANKNAGPTRIACVKLTGTYEAEEILK